MSAASGGLGPAGAQSPAAQARALIDAQLGRPVQDALEGAVVLEAWGGLPAGDALRLAHEAMALAPPIWAEEQAAPSEARGDRNLALGEIGFVIGVLFTGFWLSSLAGELGERAVDSAWRVALPVSLGLQWLLKRRYVSGDDGLGRLKQERWKVLLPTAGLLALLCLIPSGGVLAAALTVIWTGGFLITRRGWGVPYAVGLVAGAVALRALSAHALVGVATTAVVAAAALAFRDVSRSRRRPGPWLRAAPAGLIGAGLGLLLVFEPRFGWTSAGAPLSVFTVVPSLVGSLWGGYHMTRLWEVMPQVLVATSVRDRRSGTIGRLASRLLFESVARLACGVLLVSCAVLAWVEIEDRFAADRADVAGLLVAHAMLAVAALSVALLEAFGRWGWALLAVSLGVLAAFGADQLVARSVTPGTRILFGAVMALVASGIPLVGLLREPDRNLAAAL